MVVISDCEGEKDKEGKILVSGIIPTLETEGLQYQKCFIPSTYKAGTREKPNIRSYYEAGFNWR